MSCLTRFLRDQSGAVTVDWVVVAASVVGLGVGSVTVVRGGVGALGSDVSDSLSNASVARFMTAQGGFDTSNTFGLQTTPWGWVATDSHQGWFTIGENNNIEISRSGQRMITPDGQPWIDLEYYNGNVTMARVFGDMNAGQTYELSFNAADSARNNMVDVYFGGQFVERISPGSRDFSSYNINLVGGSGDGTNQLEFRGGGPEDSVGVSLHDINIQ